MNPDPSNLLEIAGINSPLIGFYDVFDIKPFEPYAKPDRCIFSSYKDWLNGESILISEGNCSCQGGGYWVGGVMPGWVQKQMEPDSRPLHTFAKGLNQREGFKSSDELLQKWFENLKPYLLENEYVVIGPLKDDQYPYLKTVTFYVNPDQLSLLLHGAEYHNASLDNPPIITAFGSGCGQVAAILGDLNADVPKAAIGATDLAMREHLPPDILAFTVNKAMYEQLCELDENSFLHKHFWERLRKARQDAFNEDQAQDDH
jgi:hypothetical protein